MYAAGVFGHTVAIINLMDFERDAILTRARVRNNEDLHPVSPPCACFYFRNRRTHFRERFAIVRNGRLSSPSVPIRFVPFELYDVPPGHSLYILPMGRNDKRRSLYANLFVKYVRCYARRITGYCDGKVIFFRRRSARVTCTRCIRIYLIMSV